MGFVHDQLAKRETKPVACSRCVELEEEVRQLKRRLAEAGVTGVTSRVTPDRNARNAERQRRYRERKRAKD